MTRTSRKKLGTSGFETEVDDGFDDEIAEEDFRNDTEEMDKPSNVDTSVEVESKSVLPKIPMKIFCSLSGKKPDQMAGFLVYARNKQFELMTIPEWRNELDAFQNKPTR